jgi:ADP-ribosyl-[dinitrogen reductase] hydrolase
MGINKMMLDEDRIAGCLLGGAVGDALGAAVEFMSFDEIRNAFGPDGIQNYAPAYGRTGAVTDDTQMTLFTLEGLLRTKIRGHEKGIASHIDMVHRAYLRWYATQTGETEAGKHNNLYNGWLINHPELHSQRAVGATCMSALQSGKYGTIEEPLNDSKGCGGLMRAAPAGLLGLKDPFRVGCDIAAITHGHPSGYLAAGFQAELIASIIAGKDLGNSIDVALDRLKSYPDNGEVLKAAGNAIELANEADAVPASVEMLGDGWVAEEALAIALFCALKSDNYIDGVRLAVNHSGDSDSTGAIVGNILGALYGKSSIPEEFLNQLEIREVIDEMASDVVNFDYTDHYIEKYPPN